MKSRRMRILGRAAVTKKIRKGRKRRGVVRCRVGYRFGNEAGQLVEDRLVLGGGAVVEARARRVHLEVAMQQKRKA